MKKFGMPKRFWTSSISAMTFSGLRARNFRVHVVFAPQNVHPYGQPRLVKMFVYCFTLLGNHVLATYCCMGIRSHAGKGIVSRSSTSSLDALTTMPPGSR